MDGSSDTRSTLKANVVNPKSLSCRFLDEQANRH